MSTIRDVERQIRRCEGFKVKFKDRQTGRDIMGNLSDIPSYPYERMARNRCSVSEWKAERFARCYSGFAVDVLNADNTVAHGRTLLATVRDTFL